MSAHSDAAQAGPRGADERHDAAQPSGDKPHRPTLVVDSQNSMLGDAADCMLAVQDIQRKSGAVQDAQTGYLACLAASVIDGRSCAAEMSNLRAAIHDLELAVFLLEQRCPWLRI